MHDASYISASKDESSFRRASFLNKNESNDFGFIKKRVRVNNVDKEINEYALE